MTKDGGRDAMDHYFHQVRPSAGSPPASDATSPQRRAPERSTHVISFGPTEEQELVARGDARVREARRCVPSRARCDEAAKLPDELPRSRPGSSASSRRRSPRRTAARGEARSPITNALVLEELAYGDAALAIAALAPARFAFAVLDQGTDEQKQRAAAALLRRPLPRRVAGAGRAGAGVRRARACARTAEPQGRRGFVLSGAKSFVPLADRASHFLVVARNGNGADAVPSAFIVPRDAAGLTIASPRRTSACARCRPARSSSSASRCPATARLGGDAGCDVRAAARRLARRARGRCWSASRARVIEYAIPYAKERVAFGEAIAQKQAIAFMLADMHIETDAMRWLIWKAASQLEQRPRRDARGAARARLRAPSRR